MISKLLSLVIPTVYAAENTQELPSLWVFGFLNPENPGSALAKVLSSFVGLIFIIGGFTGVVMVFMGGLSMISSGGDAQKLQDGRNKIMWGLFGIVVLLATWALVSLLEQMLGICLGFTCPIDLSSI